MYSRVPQSEGELVEKHGRIRCKITVALFVSGLVAAVVFVWASNVKEQLHEEEYEQTAVALNEDPNKHDPIPTIPNNVVKVSAIGQRMMGKCENWSPTFRSQYEQECGYWLGQYEEWEAALGSDPPIVAYQCDDPTLCRGWGDRLGGMENAFLKAVHSKSSFRISHPGLSSLFEPCLFEKNRANWAHGTGSSYRPDPAGCYLSQGARCFLWFQTKCPVTVTLDTDRTCMPEAACEGIHALKGEEELITPVNALGCGLRAMFEPKKELLDDVRIKVRDGSKRLGGMSVREIENYLKQFYVISIHFRLGDKYAFYHRAGAFNLDEERYARPFHCAQTLESYLIGNKKANNGEMTVDGRPVRWFLASDSYKLKLLAVKMFSNRVIILDLVPEHVAIDKKEEDLTTTLAEWYLLGLGDQLVVNKIGTTPGEFYLGRISAFPKTSWVYHLKHLVYDAGTCHLNSIPFEGTWGDVRTKKACAKTSYRNKGPNFLPQNHLKILEKDNLTFPHAYVVNGIEVQKVYVT